MEYFYNRSFNTSFILLIYYTIFTANCPKFVKKQSICLKYYLYYKVKKLIFRYIFNLRENIVNILVLLPHNMANIII
nr:MAG TPA: hypothetical protein [Caudoviricetes sp.]